MRPRSHALTACAAVFAAVALLYSRCLLCGTIPPLDGALLDSPIFALSFLQQLGQAIFARISFGGEYLPLATLSLVLQRRLGLWLPAELHAVGVILHACAAAAVCALADRVYRLASPSSGPRLTAACAAFAAFLFAAHPLRVEAVAWISARQYPMAGLFCALSALAHLEAADRRSWSWRAVSLACFAAALLSYVVSAPLPLALLALDAYPLGRLRREGVARILAEKLPYFALAFLACAHAVYGRWLGGHVLGLGLADRSAWSTAAFSLAFYLEKTAAPAGLFAGYYPACSSGLWRPAGVAGLLAVAGLIAAWRRKDLRGAVWGAAAAYGALLLPFLGVVKLDHPEFAVADRWSYLPAIPLSLLAGGAFLAWPALRSRVGRAVAAAVAVALAVASFRQQAHWRDFESLLQQAAACSPGCPAIEAWLARESARAQAPSDAWRLLMNQADDLERRGKAVEAAAIAEQALAEAERTLGRQAPEIGDILARLSDLYDSELDIARLDGVDRRLLSLPLKDARVWLAVGKAAREKGQYGAAVEYLRKAAALKPADPDTVSLIDEQLGTAYFESGRYREAAAAFSAATEKGKPRCWTYIKLAGAYHYLGEHARAKAVFERVKKVAPACFQAYVQEGYGDLEEGQDAAAREEFEKLVVVDTASAQGFRHLGSLLFYDGRYSEAESYFRRALKAWPRDPEPIDQDWAGIAMWLGIVLKAEGRGEEAEALFLRVERASRGPSTEQRFIREHALHQLGQLYSSLGRAAQAREAFQEGLDICREPRACPGFWYADALLGMAEFDADQGRKREAEELLAHIPQASFLSVNPMVFAQRCNSVAQVYSKLGEADRAKALDERVLKLYPASASGLELAKAQENLADIEASRGGLKRAQRLYLLALRAWTRVSDQDRQARLLDRLARLSEEEGDAAAADEYRRRARACREKAPQRGSS